MTEASFPSCECLSTFSIANYGKHFFGFQCQPIVSGSAAQYAKLLPVGRCIKWITFPFSYWSISTWCLATTGERVVRMPMAKGCRGRSRECLIVYSWRQEAATRVQFNVCPTNVSHEDSGILWISLTFAAPLRMNWELTLASESGNEH